MKKLASVFVMLIVAAAAFSQTYTLKTADKNPCKVTLSGDKIVIEETLSGGFINRITIPKSKFTETNAKVTSEEGGKSVINNKPHMEASDMIIATSKTYILQFLEVAVEFQVLKIAGLETSHFQS